MAFRNKGKTIASKLRQRLNDTNDVAPRDIKVWVRDKLISDTESAWFGSEFLYLVITTNKKKNEVDSNNIDNSNTNTTSSNNNTNTKDKGHDKGTTASTSNNRKEDKTERFLVLLRKKDMTNSMHIAQVVVKGHEFEVKNSWELRILRAIDYGEDDVEIVISFDAADYKIRFINSLERDETLWIIVQCCKLFIGVDVSVGYAVDIDSIGYTISTNGSLNRFPLLLGLTANLRISGDTFTEQEADAEEKLEELKWTEHGGTPHDLQQILAKETELINMEMIDFLLKWEDDGIANVNDKNNGHNDTYNILKSLSMVDGEMEGVDLWLTEQLDRLASVQERLYSIEKETGSVEATFQNLTSVKDILETFIEEMYFTSIEQDYLQHPERLIEDALDQEDLSTADELLGPLNSALGKLQLGLSINEKKLQARLDEKRKEVGSTYQGAHITKAQWKRLQSMTAFATQRNLLIDLADSFSNSVNDVAGTLFDSLLCHKALNNPSTQNITVKTFNFERMIQEGLSFGPSYFNKNNDADSGRGGRDDGRVRRDSINSNCSDVNYVPQLRMITTKKLNNSNQAIVAQRVFHGALNDFIPILEAILHLTPTLAISLSSSYVQSVYNKLYSPLLKLMLKEIRHMLHPRSSPLHLNNIPVFTLKYIFTGCPLPLRYDQHQYRDCGMLTAWGALGLAFLMLSPVIKREETFFNDIFHLDDKVVNKDDSNHDKKTKTEVMLDNLFAIIPEQVEKFMAHHGTTSGTEVDGVETLAMLVTLEIYMNDNLGVVEHEGAMHIIKDTDEYSPYFVQLLHQLKGKFISRLDLYMSEQIAWITHQKADPKKPDVLQVVSKFCFLIYQFMEVGGKCIVEGHFEIVEEMIQKLVQEVFDYIYRIASLNEKYSDTVKIRNFTFFVESMKQLDLPFLDTYMTTASRERMECGESYVKWMVSYEFEHLADLVTRMDGVGSRVREEELGLYVRRKDVLTVAKELDSYKVESGIKNMKKRLQKHFNAVDYKDIGLLSIIWSRIKGRMLDIMTRLDHLAQASYQISLSVDTKTIDKYFDQYGTF